MSHTSEKRWAFVAGVAHDVATSIVEGLQTAESMYQDLLELYAYCGSTAQGLADQLFAEDWAARSAAGVQAIMSVDIVAGSIDSVAIINGGTGYTDGVGYQITVQGGGNDGVIEYSVVAGVVTNALIDQPGSTYGNGTGIVIDGVPAPGVVFETEASAEEVAKATDLIAAMTAVHELHQAADNVAVGAEDRFVQLRRFT